MYLLFYLIRMIWWRILIWTWLNKIIRMEIKIAAVTRGSIDLVHSIHIHYVSFVNETRQSIGKYLPEGKIQNWSILPFYYVHFWKQWVSLTKTYVIKCLAITLSRGEKRIRVGHDLPMWLLALERGWGGGGQYLHDDTFQSKLEHFTTKAVAIC